MPIVKLDKANLYSIKEDVKNLYQQQMLEKDLQEHAILICYIQAIVTELNRHGLDIDLNIVQHRKYTGSVEEI